MQIAILRNDLINLDTEFNFYLQEVGRYEIHLENIQKSKLRPTDTPSENLLKIVKLLQHKVKRATQFFNDLVDTFQKDLQDDSEMEQYDSNIFYQLIDHLAIRANKILTKMDILRTRIEGMKQRIFGAGGGNHEVGNQKDAVFYGTVDQNRQRGLKGLESVISNLNIEN